MQVPFTRDVYRPMIQRLEQEGLKSVETRLMDAEY